MLECHSFAQNYEDVVLEQALGHIQNGFYIDIGAWHPDEQSVTKRFYQRGWSGVNVEPQLAGFKLFQQRRPKDVNLQVAVSDVADELVLWIPKYSALATCDFSMIDPSIADYANPVETTIQSVRLDELVRRYAANRPVHFLKIDVEGYEHKVMMGADFRRFRPWIVLVEAVSPIDGRATHNLWEPRLLAADYQCALYDGLNRFYVRRESLSSLPALQHVAGHRLFHAS